MVLILLGIIYILIGLYLVCSDRDRFPGLTAILVGLAFIALSFL